MSACGRHPARAALARCAWAAALPKVSPPPAAQQMAALLGSQPESVQQKYARMLADPSLPPPERTKILSMQKRRRERLAKAAAAASPAPGPAGSDTPPAGTRAAGAAAEDDRDVPVSDLTVDLPLIGNVYRSAAAMSGR